MSDVRQALEEYADEDQYFGREWGKSTREDIAPRAFDALREVLDKCDSLDKTDHLVARAFAQEFRDAITCHLADGIDE